MGRKNFSQKLLQAFGFWNQTQFQGIHAKENTIESEHDLEKQFQKPLEHATRTWGRRGDYRMFSLLTIVKYCHMIYPIYVRNWEKGIYLPEPNRTKKPEVKSISECSFLKYYGKH